MRPLEDLSRFAAQIARGAGDLLMERLSRISTLKVQFKGENTMDVVTAADRDAETYIRRRVLGRFPDDGFVGEEHGTVAAHSGYTWIVDPLDGTTNFIHGIPAFAVSVGVVHQGSTVAGVVHAPALDETFITFRGGGATLNGKDVRVSGVARLEESVLATGFADVRAGLSPNNLDNFNRLVMVAQGVRRFGAASIDMAYVAAGRFDAFWEIGLSPWDVCAGGLLVAEAGGRVTEIRGGPDYLAGGTVLASNGRLHEPIAAILQSGGWSPESGVRGAAFGRVF